MGDLVAKEKIRKNVFLLVLGILYGVPVFSIIYLVFIWDQPLWLRIGLAIFYGVVILTVLMKLESNINAVIVNRYVKKVTGQNPTQEQFSLCFRILIKMKFNALVQLQADAFVYTIGLTKEYQFEETAIQFFTALFCLPQEQLKGLLESNFFDDAGINEVMTSHKLI